MIGQDTPRKEMHLSFCDFTHLHLERIQTFAALHSQFWPSKDIGRIFRFRVFELATPNQNDKNSKRNGKMKISRQKPVNGVLKLASSIQRCILTFTTLASVSCHCCYAILSRVYLKSSFPRCREWSSQNKAVFAQRPQ